MEIHAVDPRSDEGRQGVFAGNCNDVAGEHFRGLDSLQYPTNQRRSVLKESFDRAFASMNSNFHGAQFLFCSVVHVRGDCGAAGHECRWRDFFDYGHLPGDWLISGPEIPY
jgi:hypothetical protein